MAPAENTSFVRDHGTEKMMGGWAENPNWSKKRLFIFQKRSVSLGKGWRTVKRFRDKQQYRISLDPHKEKRGSTSVSAAIPCRKN